MKTKILMADGCTFVGTFHKYMGENMDSINVGWYVESGIVGSSVGYKVDKIVAQL